jgi:hypothetical protein
MKFEQFQSQPKEQLDEVRMGVSDLNTFINSGEAQGIKAGFEAEMCFRGLGESETDYDEAEEDWDQDESVHDIDDACNFFDDGDYNTRRDVRDLREAMQESWYEWLSEKMDNDWSEVAEEKVREYIEENDYNQDDEIDSYLTDHLGLSREEADEVLAVTSVKDEKYALFAEAKEHAEEVLDELVKQSLENYDNSYDYAREEWEEYNRDDYEQRDWLNDIGVHLMSDVVNEFSGHVRWPYYNYPETESGYSERQAQRLADDLENALNVETYASSGYHSAKRTATRWIFEPDSSLEADEGDMPVEIISPPMPLKECLQKIEEFFIWAEGHDAYTNSSTGFHVGVSLPYVDGRIDYVKLALFLGDKHVLEQFGRLGNYYCKSSFDKIKDSVHTDKIPGAFELMRRGLIELATKTLGQNGHGKYTSINLKNDYVEFRSMGDEYHQNVGGIIDTVKRYAYAMHIASRPDLHRDEYAKKLYKMLSKSGEADAVALFSQLAAGEISKDEVRQKLVTRNVGRGGSLGKKYWWRVSNPKHSHGQIEVVASNKPEAIERALEQDGYPSWVNTKNDIEAVVVKPFEEPPVKATAGEPQPAGSVGNVPPATQARGDFTGEWKVIDNNGRELYRFGGVGNSQADANRIAQQWVNTQRAQGNVIDAREIDVLPVMGNQ